MYSDIGLDLVGQQTTTVVSSAPTNFCDKVTDNGYC